MTLFLTSLIIVFSSFFIQIFNKTIMNVLQKIFWFNIRCISGRIHHKRKFGPDMNVKSPCIDKCKLNLKTDLCEGCYRSAEEISNWKVFTNEQKKMF